MRQRLANILVPFVVLLECSQHATLGELPLPELERRKANPDRTRIIEWRARFGPNEKQLSTVMTSQDPRISIVEVRLIAHTERKQCPAVTLRSVVALGGFASLG